MNMSETSFYLFIFIFFISSFVYLFIIFLTRAKMFLLISDDHNELFNTRHAKSGRHTCLTTEHDNIMYSIFTPPSGKNLHQIS